MKTIKLNETPVRTAKNYQINNINIENFEFPKNIEKFKNIEIKNITIDEKTSNRFLRYGLGKEIEKNVLTSSNNKTRIIIDKPTESAEIVYNFDDENVNLINEIEIIAKENVNLTIKYKSNTQKPCFHNGIIRVDVTENVIVNITLVNLLNDESINLESIENNLEHNSKLYYKIIDFGGKTSISNYYSNILGENAYNELRTIYLASKGQIKDINYIAELKGKKSIINMDVQGALQDNSIKHFKGTIDFKKGCKKAKGDENEYCILLSDNAKSISLPMLLCEEEDVEGNHGVASGKVNKEELFYIMSRGLSYKESIKLIVRAKFNKLLEKIEDENTKDEIISEIDKRLE